MDMNFQIKIDKNWNNNIKKKKGNIEGSALMQNNKFKDLQLRVQVHGTCFC